MFSPLLAPILALSVPLPPVTLVPGQSLGPIALGASEAELVKAGLSITPGRFETERRVGQFDVTFADGKVSRIALELGKGPMGSGTILSIGETQFVGLSPQQIAAVIGGCGPMQRNRGGKVIECGSGATVVQHKGGMGVRVGPASTSINAPVCDGYLEPGNAKSKLKVEPGKTYCLPSRLVNSAVRPDDVLGSLRYNTCQEQPNRGATTITCPFQGTRFVFAGPTLVLTEVSGVPMQK
ncbi:MAG: hypothetical protein ACI9U2_001364 [Bradymonadia bacterium]|jgi:hypothetical protein